MTTLALVHTCPTCGGSGTITELPCEHAWRLVQSMHGENFNYQVWACMNDECRATVCSDCVSDGFPTCAARNQDTKGSE